MKSTIRIIIADDHQLFADGIFLLLKPYTNIQVVGTVSDGKQLMEFYRQAEAHIILLDIKMPGFNGIEVLEKMLEETKVPKVIMLSTYADPEIIQRCKKLGASGYLLKNCSKEELYEAIVSVASGHNFFPSPSPLDGNMVDQITHQYKLTKRRERNFDVAKNGATNESIAETLHLSLYTVETHRKHVMHKLGIKSPQGLIKLFTEEVRIN